MEENIPPVPEQEQKNGQLPADQGKQSAPKKKISTKTILILVAVAVAIITPVVIYFVMDAKISRLQREQQKEIAAVQGQAAEMVRQVNEINLQHMAKVFSWAIRAEAMRNNAEQMNQMVTELVKIDEYQKVVLLAENGSVVISSDKKYEGEGLSESFYQSVIGSNEVKIYPQKNGDLFVSAPVFGIDTRLGTVVIAYKPSALEFPPLPGDSIK